MDKVTEAMGYEVNPQQIENAVHEYQGVSTYRLKYELARLTSIENAVHEYQGVSTYRLKYELARLTSMFDDLGGRGVDLADQIDNIRIALAMRE